MEVKLLLWEGLIGLPRRVGRELRLRLLTLDGRLLNLYYLKGGSHLLKETISALIYSPLDLIKVCGLNLLGIEGN